MAEYKTSKESRNKILEACKELFYLHGYKKTTYKDICKKASSNPGLINYYFKTKKNIAGTIYGNFFSQIKEKVKIYMLEKYNYYDLQYGTAIEQLIFSKLMDNNEKIENFYYDIALEGIEYDLEILYYFYKLHVDEYNLGMDEDHIKLIQTNTIASGIGVTKRVVEGYFNIDKDELFDFRVRSMYNSMGISNERVDEILKVSREIYSKMEIKLHDYFIIEIR
ncbi:MAG: TetR/AcrR family transcriptional regulator [Eubacteriaceae bacterium]